VLSSPASGTTIGYLSKNSESVSSGIVIEIAAGSVTSVKRIPCAEQIVLAEEKAYPASWIGLLSCVNFNKKQTGLLLCYGIAI
jgi:hypothetical protein